MTLTSKRLYNWYPNDSQHSDAPHPLKASTRGEKTESRWTAALEAVLTEAENRFSKVYVSFFFSCSVCRRPQRTSHTGSDIKRVLLKDQTCRLWRLAQNPLQMETHAWDFLCRAKTHVWTSVRSEIQTV